MNTHTTTFRALSRRALAFGLLWIAGSPAASQDAQDPIQLSAGRSVRYETSWSVAGVSLTDPTIADVQVLTPTLVLLTGLEPGVTDAFVWSDNGESASLLLEVRRDLDPLQRDLEALFPGASLDIAESSGGLVVSGDLGGADQAPRLRAYLDLLGHPYVDATRLPGVQQVQVRVKIAEVSRTALRELGVNAAFSGEDGFLGSTIGPNGGPINPVSIGAPEGASAQGGTPYVYTDPVTISPSVTLFGGLPQENLEVFLQALAQNQYLRILAEPTLVALSGEEASFLAGGEFPIPVVQGTGGSGGLSVTIEFKEFGVGLRFKPLVLGNGEIQLAVKSEVSEISDIGSVEIQGFQVPSIATRRTDTTLNLRSGQTFAMAGLLKENVAAQSIRTPGLGQPSHHRRVVPLRALHEGRDRASGPRHGQPGESAGRGRHSAPAG